jgi:phosphatidylglycerophosphatase A
VSDGPRFSHPGLIVATWFGAGLLPRVPGTWGSLAALPFAWLIHRFGGASALVAAAFVLFLIGIWAAEVAMHALNEDDPGAIVVDEVAGQWLTLAAAPFGIVWWILGFLLFRLFDIWKPWPIRQAEKKFSGGFGVMADDIVAALYAVVLLLIGRRLLGA